MNKHTTCPGKQIAEDHRSVQKRNYFEIFKHVFKVLNKCMLYSWAPCRFRE